NILAAFATLGAVIYVVYPSGRNLAEQMEWSRTNIVISVGTIIMTVVALGASAAFLNYQAQQLDLEENPPPQIVNTVLPDMGSIALVGGLLQSNCPTWTDEALSLLASRASSFRDEDLFAITQEGWRDLASCDTSLTTTQRWHLVNYLRTLRHD